MTLCFHDFAFVDHCGAWYTQSIRFLYIYIHERLLKTVMQQNMLKANISMYVYVSDTETKFTFPFDSAYIHPKGNTNFLHTSHNFTNSVKLYPLN